jgi:hypothetical protein
VRRRTGIILGAIAAVVIAGGAATAWWLLSRPAGPDAAAAAYLQALSAKDGAAAAALLADDSDADSLAAAFSGATAYPSATTVRSVAEHGSRATARVTFRLDGKERTATLDLIRDDHGWRLGTGALGSVTATTSMGDAVSVGGRLVRAGQTARVLPAVYPVTAVPARILTGSAPATALPGGSTEVAVAAALAPDAAATAGAQLEQYEDACTAPATAVPSHCGLRVPWAADLATLTSLAFRIDKRPAVTLAADAKTFAATGGAVVATARGTTRAGTSATFTYRALDWALRGSVSFAGGTMTLSVD